MTRLVIRAYFMMIQTELEARQTLFDDDSKANRQPE